MSSSFNRRFGMASKISLAAGAAITLTVASTPAMAVNEARSFIGWGRWNNNNTTGAHAVIAMVEPGHPLPDHVALQGKIDLQISWPFDQSGFLSGIVMQPGTPLGEPTPGRNWYSTHATAVASALVGTSPTVTGIAPDASLLTAAIATHINPLSGAFSGSSPTSIAFALFALTDQEIADSVAAALGIPPYQVATVVNSSFKSVGPAARAGAHPNDRIYNAVAFMTGATLIAPAGDADLLFDDLQPPQGSMRAPGAAFNTIAVGRTDVEFTTVADESSGGQSPTVNWPVAGMLLPPDLDTFDQLPNTEDELLAQDRHGVDIVAPGTLLRLAGSQANPVNDPSPTAFSDFWIGTSFSSAIVAGAAALVHDYGNREGLWHNGKAPAVVTRALLLNSTSKLSFNNSIMFDEDRRAFVTTEALDEREGAGQLDMRRLWNQVALADVKDFVEPDDPRYDGKNTLEGFTLDDEGDHTVPVFGTNPDVTFTSFIAFAPPEYDDEGPGGPGGPGPRGAGPLPSAHLPYEPAVRIPYMPGAPWLEDETAIYVAQGGLGSGSNTDLGDDSFSGPLVPPTLVPGFPRPQTPTPPEPPDNPFGPQFRTGWDHGRAGFGIVELPIGVVTAGSTITATLCWQRHEVWELPDFAAPLAMIDPELVVPAQFLGAGARSARNLKPNPTAPERVHNAKPIFERWDRRITPLHGGCACGFNVESITTRDGHRLSQAVIDQHFDTAMERMRGEGLRLANAHSNSRGMGLNIQYILSEDVAADPMFVAGLELAAQIWESLIEDPTSIQIFVDFSSPDAPFVAAAGTVSNGFEYEDVRQALVAKATPLELNAINALPMGSISFVTTGFMGPDMDIPLELTSDDFGGITVYRPLARALGFDVASGVDALIVFNPSVTFDLDPSDGITVDFVDLVYVMVHELGHMLGFTSSIDVSSNAPIDEPPPSTFPPTVLDLFRFGFNGADNEPESPADFTMFPREFRPGVEAALNTVDLIPEIDQVYRFSTGPFNGDGRQTSHWKDDIFLGLPEVIGVMDPTVGPPSGYSEGYPKTSDMLAMGLIGWNIDFTQDPPQPGPGTGGPPTREVPVIRFTDPGVGGSFQQPAEGILVEFAHQNLNFQLWIRAFDGVVNDLYMVSEGLELTEGGADGGEMWRTTQHLFAPGVPFGNYFLRIVWDRVAFDFGGFFLGSQQSVAQEGFTRAPVGSVEYGVAWYIDLVDTGGEFLTDTPPARLPADFNGDGVVDSADLAILLSEFGRPSLKFDLTGDGRIGSADLSALLGSYGRTR